MPRISNIARSLTAGAFWCSGLPTIIRHRHRKAVVILTYHNPDPGIFETHLRYIRKRFNVIPLDTLVRAMKTHDWGGIPRKALVITLDDGYKENYRLASLFATYGVVPTIYLCSHVVDTHRHFWFESKRADVSGLKKLNSPDLLGALGESEGYRPDMEFEDRQTLDGRELREMKSHVDFQSHSRFHPVLPACDEAEIQEEVEGSRRRLEEILQSRVVHFSYPNGDYSPSVIEQVIASGYESARTLDIGWNDRNTDRYRLKAMPVQDDASIPILCAQVHGVFGYIKYAFHGSFKGLRPPRIT